MKRSTKIILGVIGFSILLGFLGNLGSTNSSVKSAATSRDAQLTISPIKTVSIAITKPTPKPTAIPTPTSTPTPTKYIVPTNTYVQPTTPPATDQSSGLSNDNYYTNSDVNQVHSPAYSTTNSAPAGATAICGDGTYSFSQHHSGTCSHHGGVSQWL